MKMKFLLGWVAAVLLLLAGCSSDDDTLPASSFTLSVPADGISLGYEKGSQQELSFTAAGSWRAKVDVDWATVTPMTGAAGGQTLRVIAKTLNNTGRVRQGNVTLLAASDSVVIPFSQAMTDVVNLEQQEYRVGAEGGQVSVKFSSNIRGYKVLVVSNADRPAWIKGVKDANGENDDAQAGAGEGLQESEYLLEVLPNEAHKSRSVSFYIRIVNPANHDEVYITSGLFNIVQEGLPVETSTDYSRHNTWVQLQTHTVGGGVPLVIMGDGFVDKEINSGHYDKVMRQAMEQLFTEEPVKSLRAYFDVWQVTQVSRNNAFGSEWQTALGCEVQGEGSSRIVGDFDKVVAATKCVDALQDMSRLREALTVVILNTPDHAGTTHFAISFENVMSDFAIAYVPLINNDPLDDDFRAVLCHEALGHGLGKLLDEYAYAQNDANVPTSDVTKYRRLQDAYGWAQNVSFSSTDVPWSHLLADSRYQAKDVFGETLGIYEGACGYLHGAWRPTDDSMMFHNQHGFNAPSREAIYKHVMRVAMGDGWTYDAETFMTFDQAHLPQPSQVTAKAPRKFGQAFEMVCPQTYKPCPPVIGR